MNRRGFLRGAISVMAVAAVLKGRVTEDVIRATNPAYRWTSYMVLENFEVGENPNIALQGSAILKWVPGLKVRRV
jgi:hypothetical protein